MPTGGGNGIATLRFPRFPLAAISASFSVRATEKGHYSCRPAHCESSAFLRTDQTTIESMCAAIWHTVAVERFSCAFSSVCNFKHPRPCEGRGLVLFRCRVRQEEPLQPHRMCGMLRLRDFSVLTEHGREGVQQREHGPRPEFLETRLSPFSDNGGKQP